LHHGHPVQPFFLLVAFFDFFSVRSGDFPGCRDQGDPLRFRKTGQEFGTPCKGFQDGNTVSDDAQGNDIVLFRFDGVRLNIMFVKNMPVLFKRMKLL
jgi:hypothetical protein